MSEIFDFLKKTEAERKRSSALPVSELDMPAAEPIAPKPEQEVFLKMEAPVPVESDVLNSEPFDLSQATHQMLSVLDPMTMFGEQFRVLRTKLGLMQKQTGIKTILVTSTVPQEGKSFTASALAGVFAQEEGKRVVIIDTDMRKNGSGKDFGLNGNSGNVGTAQVLQGVAEFRTALLKSQSPEFWFLPAGSLPKNPSELLSSPNLEQLLKTAAESFDLVIVDSPPVLSLSDPTLIAPLCDTVVLVVRANSTPSKFVQETINRIGREKICGVVLNRQKQLRTSRYYYQYYYQKSSSSK